MDPVPEPPRRSQAATHKLIAEQAGVHPSTVSRILRRDEVPSRADFAATAARVREIALSLGYRPDLTAASLRTRRTRVFGVLLPQLHDVVLATILSGVDSEAFGLGYQTIVTNTFGDTQRRRERVEMLLSRRVDGLVIGDATLDDETYDELESTGTRVVLVNHRRPGMISVTGADEHGGRLVGEHLANLGHTDVGIVAGPGYPVVRERVRGCVRALETAGVDVPRDRVLHSSFDAEGGREATEILLAAGRTPTAIFAVNDSAAIGVMGCLRDHGLTVGRDVAVVGYNDIAIAKDLPIPLTSVHAPLRTMGETAAKLLVDLVEGSSAQSVDLPPTLEVRESSGSQGR